MDFVVLQASMFGLVMCAASVAAAAKLDTGRPGQELETAESKPKRSIGGGKISLYIS
jgi:hypothetical protein